MDERKQINFTIVPDDKGDVPGSTRISARSRIRRLISRCPSARSSRCRRSDIQQAQTNHVVRAPVRAKIAVPLQVVPNLIAALQEHMRVFSESTGASWDKGPVH